MVKSIYDSINHPNQRVYNKTNEQSLQNEARCLESTFSPRNVEIASNYMSEMALSYTWTIGLLRFLFFFFGGMSDTIMAAYIGVLGWLGRMSFGTIIGCLSYQISLLLIMYNGILCTTHVAFFSCGLRASYLWCDLGSQLLIWVVWRLSIWSAADILRRWIVR